MIKVNIPTYSDYYPFGMLQPNRHGGESYTYNFQGQETDDEIKGKGNSVSYKYRMHDPRLGRFFAVDPLSNKYPYNSPYAFSENRVIDSRELEGLESVPINVPNNAGDINHYLPDGTTEIKKYTSTSIKGNVTGNIYEVVKGSVASFKYGGTTYYAQFAKETGVFQGYSSDGGENYFFAMITDVPVTSNDDYSGYIQNATSEDRLYDPTNAFLKDLSADGLNYFYVFGTIDDAVVTYNDPTASVADKIAAWTPVLLTTRGTSGKTIKLRHYTSNKGFTGIKSSGVINASDANRVFATKAKGKALSKTDAQNKLGIKDGRNYIEFEVDASNVDTRKNKYTGATEYSVKGNVSIDVSKSKFVKRK